MKKINVCGRVNIKVLKEFNENLKHLDGPLHGSRGRGLETSMRIMNNYFKIYHNKRLIDIANNRGLKPWELGEVIILDWLHDHG